MEMAFKVRQILKKIEFSFLAEYDYYFFKRFKLIIYENHWQIIL